MGKKTPSKGTAKARAIKPRLKPKRTVAFPKGTVAKANRENLEHYKLKAHQQYLQVRADIAAWKSQQAAKGLGFILFF